MLAAVLVVLVIAQDKDDPLAVAFERAARGVLGEGAKVELVALATDPPDADSEARGRDADGVIELSWAKDGSRARIHCYLTREQRWVDRDIDFGGGKPGAVDRETSERGRLLGFAAATMFAPDAARPSDATPSEPRPPSPSPSPSPPASASAPAPAAAAARSAVAPRPSTADAASQAPVERAMPRRSLEFAGLASSGVEGTAAGLGAMAGARLSLSGPLGARVFVAGLTGNIPKAQASTRTAIFGAGATLRALPASSRFHAGLRLDAFASYFDASHLSEDDIAPDRRSRWLPGADVVAEGGFCFVGSASLFIGAGMQAMFGKTEVFTHGNRVAVVPPLRLLGEVGLRTGF